MSEYSPHIEKYLDYWFSSYSKYVPEKIWGNRQLAEKFMEKFWLSEVEYKNEWAQIKQKIFFDSIKLPNHVFQNGYEVVERLGGRLFNKNEFEQLMSVISSLRETHFVVIQDRCDFKPEEPMFRMKFPVGISWEELMQGNYISAVLFEMNYNNYFVFGQSKAWGKYSLNDSHRPVDLLGVKKENIEILKDLFYGSNI